MNAAIGVADHSGWAVVVALGGGLDAPTVLLRERITTLPASLPRQPYHAVAEEGAPRGIVAEVAAAAYAASVKELRRLIGALRDAGHDLTQVAVAAGTSRIPSELDRILASHTLLHAAEGELYRTAIAEAATDLSLHVLRFDKKAIVDLTAGSVDRDPAAVRGYIERLRQSLGAPWQADHKLATAAAWWALSVGARGKAPVRSGMITP